MAPLTQHAPCDEDIKQSVGITPVVQPWPGHVQEPGHGLQVRASFVEALDNSISEKGRLKFLLFIWKNTK